MMSELPKWDERPRIIGNLLNPAFCAEVIRVSTKAYSEDGRRPMPYALVFLVLAFTLHRTTREALPSSVRTHFYAWLASNPQIKIDIGDRIKSLVPFTKEALIFLASRRLIVFDQNGGIETLRFTERRAQQNDEIGLILKKAKLFGRLLARAGTVTSIYSILGIKP